MWFKSAGRKKLEALIDDLACTYLRDDPADFEHGRAEICRQIAEIADGLRSAGRAKTIAKVRAYQPGIEVRLPPEDRRHMQYLIARALM